MITRDYCRTLSRYNRWMNQQEYTLAAGLSDDVRRRDQGLTFRSVHGVMNHVLLADLLWLARFQGGAFPMTSLAQELYADFAELRQAREAMDAAIIAWVDSLTDEALTGTLSFTSAVRPQPRTMPLWLAVTHFFNHQTHHRGQISALLEQASLDIGVTDLLWLPAEPD